MTQNFTAIDDLIHEHRAMKHGAGTATKEVLSTYTPETTKSDEHEKSEEQESNKDVNKYITSKKDDSISLPPDLKKAGLQTQSDTDDQFKSAMYKIKFPISDDEIMEDLKAPPSESKRWFATILLYILERAHLTLKKVGTRVVRIFKTS
jgi:5'-3' exonuclease